MKGSWILSLTGVNLSDTLLILINPKPSKQPGITYEIK